MWGALFLCSSRWIFRTANREWYCFKKVRAQSLMINSRFDLSVRFGLKHEDLILYFSSALIHCRRSVDLVLFVMGAALERLKMS